MTSVSEDQRLNKRGAILRAARRCFIQHGFHATGMAEICLAAEMSAGNVYRYFHNKAAIIQAIADETRHRIVPVYEKLQSHEDPIEGIIQIILHSVRELCGGAEGRLWLDVLAEASRNDSMRQLCISFDRQLRESLMTLLSRIAKAKTCLAGIDIEAASMWLIALLDGVVARVALDPNADLQKITATLAAIIRRGLGAQAA